jgi:hypothetical protein
MAMLEDGADTNTEEDLPIQKAPSFVDLIKQDLDELNAVVDVYIPVAGYEQSRLAVKYGLPESGKQLEALGRKVVKEFPKKTWEQNLYIAIDTMILLCEGLYAKPGDLEEYAMVDLDELGEPVRFDHRLATMIGLNTPNPTARAVVRKLFGNNDFKILGHAERLNRWLANSKADVEAEFWQLGEA